jgi:hypothetical protein
MLGVAVKGMERGPNHLHSIQNPLFVSEMGMVLELRKIIGLEKIVRRYAGDNSLRGMEQLPLLAFDELF